MIDYELFAKIRHLTEHEGLTPPQIAAQLALDPRTVRKWLDTPFQPRTTTQRPSKLDPFKSEIVRMLHNYPYTATQIFQRIQEQGFEGGYNIVKRYVRKVRPPKSPAFLTLSFAPGRLGILRRRQCGLHQEKAQFLCHGSVLQPHDVRGIYRLSNYGALPGVSSKCL
jgi:hypothetical protein